jgi:hypothetical protein
VNEETNHFQAAETDLRQLMDDVSRAMARAEAALAKLGGKAVECPADIGAPSQP